MSIFSCGEKAYLYRYWRSCGWRLTSYICFLVGAVRWLYRHAERYFISVGLFNVILWCSCCVRTTYGVSSNFDLCYGKPSRRCQEDSEVSIFCWGFRMSYAVCRWRRSLCFGVGVRRILIGRSTRLPSNKDSI